MFGVLVRKIRSLGIRASIYMDDILIASSDFETCLKHTSLVISILEEAGVTINFEKSAWTRVHRDSFFLLQPADVISASDRRTILQRARDLRVSARRSILVNMLSYIGDMIPRHQPLLDEILANKCKKEDLYRLRRFNLKLRQFLPISIVT